MPMPCYSHSQHFIIPTQVILLGWC